MPTGTAMHHVAGSDRPFAPILVTYAKSKPKPRGLDWSKHRAPDATPDEVQTVLERRDRNARPSRSRRKSSGHAARFPDAEQAAAIVAGYQAGQTIHELTATHHRSATTIYQCVREAGVPLRGNAGHRPANKLIDDPALIADVVRFRVEDQLTQSQIATKVGCSKPLVAAILRNAGHGPLPKSRPGSARPGPVSIVDTDEAVRLYESGMTVPQLAADRDWPISSVRTVLKRAGVTMRDDRARRSGGAHAIDRRDPSIVDRIRDLYGSGLSQAQVGVEVGLTAKVVGNVMRRHGIPARDGQTGGGDTLAGYRDRLQRLGVTSATVRAWAQHHGVPVPVRGALPGVVLDAYEEAPR